MSPSRPHLKLVLPGTLDVFDALVCFFPLSLSLSLARSLARSCYVQVLRATRGRGGLRAYWDLLAIKDPGAPKAHVDSVIASENWRMSAGAVDTRRGGLVLRGLWKLLTCVLIPFQLRRVLAVSIAPCSCREKQCMELLCCACILREIPGA
jgi:hypothetical protein